MSTGVYIARVVLWLPSPDYIQFSYTCAEEIFGIISEVKLYNYFER